jgi:acyl dehydratase
METVGLGFFGTARRAHLQDDRRTITETDIVNFVNTTGMVEVLFTIWVSARGLRHQGPRCPGALAYCIAEGLLVQSTMQHTGYAFLGMELEIKGPVFAGDTIHVECEVIEARLSRSRPGRGLVRTRNKIVKQDGTVALIYTPLRMIKCRNQDAK